MSDSANDAGESRGIAWELGWRQQIKLWFQLSWDLLIHPTQARLWKLKEIPQSWARFFTQLSMTVSLLGILPFVLVILSKKQLSDSLGIQAFVWLIFALLLIATAVFSPVWVWINSYILSIPSSRTLRPWRTPDWPETKLAVALASPAWVFALIPSAILYGIERMGLVPAGSTPATVTRWIVHDSISAFWMGCGLTFRVGWPRSKTVIAIALWIAVDGLWEIAT